MVTLILSIVSGIFSVAGKVFELLHARHYVDVGKTQQKLEDLSRQIRDAQIAVSAREAIRAATAAQPDSVSDDDEFSRD